MALSVVKLKKSPKKKIFLVLKIITVFIVLLVLISLITQNVKINEKQRELELLQAKIVAEQQKNAEIEKIYKSSDEKNSAYLEQRARALGFSKKGERIFVNVAGE